jgi:hypothetical protein
VGHIGATCASAERDGLVLDYLLGAWHSAAGEALDAVPALIEQGQVDGVRLGAHPTVSPCRMRSHGSGGNGQ